MVATVSLQMLPTVAFRLVTVPLVSAVRVHLVSCSCRSFSVSLLPDLSRFFFAVSRLSEAVSSCFSACSLAVLDCVQAATA